MTARTGKDPGIHYKEITEAYGTSYYTRIDAPATPAEKEILKQLNPESVKAATLAGDAITARMTRAPGNHADLGGLKVATEHGWFAARPSGTEDVYKIYAESLRSEAHLQTILSEAKEIVAAALASH
jgi:phosphoglucomutase